MDPYIIEKNGRFYFRRNFPAGLRPKKSSTFFLLLSLHSPIWLEAGRNARVLETFSSFIFERLGQLVQLGAININTEAVLAIRQGMQQVCHAWLERQKIEKALAGPLSPEQIATRTRLANNLVQQTKAAIAANNPEIVSEIFEEGMKLIGLETQEDQNILMLAQNEALVAFNQAAIINAEREMGHFREHFASPATSSPATNVVSFPGPGTQFMVTTPTTSSPASDTKAEKEENQKPKKSQVDKFSDFFFRFAETDFAVPGGNKRNEGRKVKDPKSVGDFINMSKEFIEVCDDKEITEYTHHDIVRYIDWLTQVPSMHGKHGKNGSSNDAQIVYPSLQEQIEEADLKDHHLRQELDSKVESGDLRESEAELVWEEQSIKRLSCATINKRLSRVAKLFAFARQELRIDANIDLVDHITPNRLKQEPVPTSYRKLSDDEVDLVLGHETYNKDQGWPESVRLKGVNTLAQFGYWSILFSFFAGMRLEEIGQIRLQDIKQRHGVAFIQVRNSEVQSIKNENANREVPVPQIILDLGFMDMIIDRRKTDKPRDWVFNELERDSRHKRTAKFFQVLWALEAQNRFEWPRQRFPCWPGYL